MTKEKSSSEIKDKPFSAAKRGVQKKVKIGGVEVISTIVDQNTSLDDIRGWWKAYLSQKYEAEVGEWSGKGTEL